MLIVDLYHRQLSKKRGSDGGIMLQHIPQRAGQTTIGIL